MTEKKKKLLPRQERFCQEYMVDMKPMASAIRAGYAKKNAANTAYKFLHHPTYSHIQNRIVELESEMAEKRGLSSTWVIDRFLKIVNDDISNYFNHSEDKNGDGSSTLKNLELVDTWNIQELSYDKQGRPKVKLYSKDSALAKIGEILGTFKANDDKLKQLRLELDRERFEFEKKIKSKDGDGSLNDNIKHIKTLSDYINNPQPNRSIDDE